MSVPPKSVAVPALDLKAQYQSIRDEIDAGRPAGHREPDVRPGPRGRAARGRGGRLLRRGPRDRLRVGDRCPAPAPDGAGDRAGRRGHHDALHLLRHGRLDLADRRPAGLRRHRARHLQHRPRADRGGHHAADPGDHPGPPLRPDGRHGPDQRDRRPARPVRARGRRPGHRRGLPGPAGRRRSATPRRSASTRRRTSAASATPAWSPPTTPPSAGSSPGSGSTAWSRSTTTTRSASTPGSTPSRPPSSASSSATSTPGPTAAATVADRYDALFRADGLDELVTLPVERPGHHHVYNQYVIRVPGRRPRRPARRPRPPARSGPRSTTRSRSTSRPASPRSATSPATSPSPRPPPARRSPCRCTPS